jgi:hypothetical protein
MTLRQAKKRARERNDYAEKGDRRKVYRPRFKFEDIDADTSTERDGVTRMRPEDIERGQVDFNDD